MVVGVAGTAEVVADPDRGEAVQAGDLPRPGRRRADPVAGLEELDAGHLAEPSVRQVEPLPDLDAAGEDPDVGDLLAGRPPLDLEDAARRGRGVVGGRDREEIGDALHQVGDPRAGGCRAGVHRMEQPGGGLLRDTAPQSAYRAEATLDVRREQVVVVLGEGLGLAVAEADVVGSVRREPRGAAAGVVHAAHRQEVGGQPLRDRGEDGVDVGAGAVDLVDEQQGRHVEALQRPHQDPGLRLHALDGREHEDRPVEDGERALDLGDEVRVAGGVDDVDGQVAERERHDRGADGDAAAPLEGEGVGLGGAGVDRPRGVDDSGEVQEPLGERGLTGVDVRQDAEVELTCGHARSLRGGGSGRERALLASRCLLSSISARTFPAPPPYVVPLDACHGFSAWRVPWSGVGAGAGIPGSPGIPYFSGVATPRSDGVPTSWGCGDGWVAGTPPTRRTAPDRGPGPRWWS